MGPCFLGRRQTVQNQLQNVQQVQGTAGAFAAILADRSVVAWGHPDCAGDSSAVKDRLQNVQLCSRHTAGICRHLS
jgi:hypothetical protein